MRGENPMHPMGDVLCKVGAHDEMHVVRHEAGCEYWQLPSLLRARDQREELLVIRRFVKNLRLEVAAIEDVVTLFSNDGSSRPWHTRIMRGTAANGCGQIPAFDAKMRLGCGSR